MWTALLDLFATDTVTIQMDAVSSAMWDTLRGYGYVGVPTDGMEALYVPEYVATQACVTAVSG